MQRTMISSRGALRSAPPRAIRKPKHVTAAGFRRDFLTQRTVYLIRGRYLLGLCLIALLGICGSVFVQVVVAAQERNANVVNIAGRQRMLSQRSALFASLLVQSNDELRAQRRATLQASLDLMERSHSGLSQGNLEFGLSVPNSPELRAMYFAAPMRVDQQVRRFILHGRNILAASAADLAADSPDLQAMLEASGGPLLKALDAVTTRYANENRAEIGGLRTAESLVLGVLLITLLLEAIFIFRPLEREVGRRTTELVRAYDETIEGWSRALDLRDHETEGHSVRVTEMTLRLARMTGMNGQDLVQVRRGALLHDIGKVGIPDAILLKPGPLDESEWTVMRRHPGFAGDLLGPIEFLQPALSIPLSHHERWDGTGYPDRLTGEDIPFSARLFAVVDIWDALKSKRPYREGWPTDRVRSHVKDLCGTHLDPAVVKLFLDNEAQILAGLYEDT